MRSIAKNSLTNRTWHAPAGLVAETLEVRVRSKPVAMR
jgi:hypothetical protein